MTNGHCATLMRPTLALGVSQDEHFELAGIVYVAGYHVKGSYL